jgi:hypothetical protein
LRGCFLLLLLLLGCPFLLHEIAAGGIAFGLRNPLNLAAAAAATCNTICHLSSKRSASEDWQKKQWFL